MVAFVSDKSDKSDRSDESGRSDRSERWATADQCYVEDLSIKLALSRTL